MKHVIQKQRIEFELKPGNDVFRMQQKMSDYYHQYILPEMEKIFDQLATENELMKIDKLVIDLGCIRAGENETVFIENLSSVLTKQIMAYIRSQKVYNIAEHNEAPENAITIIPIVTNATEQWFHYLQTGMLPWTITETGDAWKTKVLEGLATEFLLIEKLRTAIRENSKALSRIIRDHPESFLVKVIEVLTAREQIKLPEIIREVQRFINIVDQRSASVHGFSASAIKPAAIWMQVLKLAAIKNSDNDSIDIATQLINFFVPGESITNRGNDNLFHDFKLLQPIVEKLTGKNKQDKQTPDTRDNKNNKSKETKHHNNERGQSRGNIEEQVQGDKKAEAYIKDHTGHKSIADEVIQYPAFNSSANKIPPEGFFANHAGLILLHPFFRFLFKNVSLTEEGKFVDRIKQEKAILLLHYLATGEKESEDHQLIIPKIICSWPLDEPLTVDTSINEQEIIEADDLIRAAISQWVIIKNTSADGLREGFLHRKGKVFSRNENIHIQVEKSTIDVLLDHLPWNLSIIKFPWQEKMIYVEWR